ncbi:hypothetical protein EYF80_048834 [Liparis tanakae]|uniref:Uncharacterized protein n=1 Tax=Liparis tanakae TaxID=230148 RepID=A0A4Z2FIG6_9TELE|nr:hypothetical protein EYF80_048834 [Liparis tanakae]
MEAGRRARWRLMRLTDQRSSEGRSTPPRKTDEAEREREGKETRGNAKERRPPEDDGGERERDRPAVMEEPFGELFGEPFREPFGEPFFVRVSSKFHDDWSNLPEPDEKVAGVDEAHRTYPRWIANVRAKCHGDPSDTCHVFFFVEHQNHRHRLENHGVKKDEVQNVSLK